LQRASDTGAASQQIVVHPVRREVPLLLQVVTPIARLEVIGVAAEPVVTAVPNHVVIARRHLVQDAEDEAVTNANQPPANPARLNALTSLLPSLPIREAFRVSLVEMVGSGPS